MNKSPEPIILAVVLGLLALGAGFLAYTFPSLQDITNVSSTLPTGKAPPKLNNDEMQASFEPWNSPAEWKAPDNQHRLFISREYLFYPDQYPDGNYIVPIDNLARSPGGVLLSWYKKYQIDFTEPDVDRADPDGDGFSNIEEFKNGVAKASDCDGSKSSNPIDPQSHPGYIGQFRLQKYESKPFRIQFRGIQEITGKTYYQIYLQDVPGPQQPGFKLTGDKLGFDGYVIGPYVHNIVTKKDPATGLTSDVDESTLELDQPDTGNKVILPYRQIIDSPESTADFVMLMPTEVDKVIKVAPLQVFTLPFITNKKFLVIKVTDSGATIRDTTTKEDISVPKLDPAEWDEVPIPTATTPPPKTP